jgi:hypothetical protein
MKTVRIPFPRAFLGCCIMVFLLLSSWIGTASAEMLPEGRRVKWEGNVGVFGDIMSRTKIRNCVTSDGAHADGTNTVGQIAACIGNTSSGGVAYLPAGTYTISSQIIVPANKTLRGAGMGKTTLRGASGFSGSQLIYSGTGSDVGTSYNITAGNAKESTRITTSSAHGFRVGQYVVIDQLQDPSGNPTISSAGYGGTCRWCSRENGERPFGQSNLVVRVPSSTQMELEIPLYWTYDLTKTPQVSGFPVVSGAGVEDLTVDNSDSAADYTIQFQQVANSWLYRVEAISTVQQMVRVYGAYRITIRGCKFHEGNPTSATTGSGSYGPSRGYGIKFESIPSSGNLIENNIFYHHSMAMADEGPFSGNVFAYNYVTAMYHADSGTAGEAMTALHGAHPYMNLWEGNYSDGKFGADSYWGSSSHNTIFRNRVANEAGFTNTNFIMDINGKSQYYNMIGNVFGEVGTETQYQFDNVDRSLSTKAIYSLGYTGAGDDGAAGNDPQVAATIYRHGNWDSVNNSVMWDGSNSDRAIPGSLYLASRPSWWCAETPIPPIGPDVSPMTSDIPAKRIYEGGTCSDSVSVIRIPMPPVIKGLR